MVILLGKCGHHVPPFDHGVRDHESAVIFPVLLGAEPESGKSVVVSGEHKILFCPHLGGRRLKFSPVLHFLLYRAGVIRAKNLFRDGPAVNKYARRRLPCHCLENSLVRGSHLLRKGELVLQLFVCKADLFPDVQRIIAVYIDRQILLRRQVEINSLVRLQVLRSEELFRDKIHVLVFFLRDHPVYGDIPDPAFSVLDIFIAGIVHDKQRFQRLVPAEYVQDFSLALSADLLRGELFFRLLGARRLCLRSRRPCRSSLPFRGVLLPCSRQKRNIYIIFFHQVCHCSASRTADGQQR